MKKLIFIVASLFVTHNALAGTCSSISRSNVAANSVLTSTEYNTSLNSAYSSINAADGGCVTDGTLEYLALNTTDFAAVLNGVKEGCIVTATDTNTLSVDRCMISVNGKLVRTTTATTVTWGCSGCSSETASTLYYLYAKTGSISSTLTLLITTTAPNGDGYDVSGDRLLATFVNNVSSNIESVLTQTAGDKVDDKWRLSASIAGAQASMGTVDISTFTGIEDAGLTLTVNSGSINARIPCSSTNAPTGTTCGVGSESLGISFFMPKVGTVMACVNFTHLTVTGASGNMEAGFAIVETPINAQTISQEGASHIYDRFSTASSNFAFPFRLCAPFTFASTGLKALRLFYEQDITATLTSSLIDASQSAAYGQPDVSWEVYPLQ